MRMNKPIALCDLYKLAVLDLFRISPTRIEHDGRYWSFFDQKRAAEILQAYEAGDLNAPLRDFVASVLRVKNKIFEFERTKEMGKVGIGKNS